MENPYVGQRGEGMAPPALEWHYAYELAFQQISEIFWELERLQSRLRRANNRGVWDDGDLGDYAETIATLLSFMPHTRDDIRKQAKEDFIAARASGEYRSLIEGHRPGDDEGQAPPQGE